MNKLERRRYRKGPVERARRQDYRHRRAQADNAGVEAASADPLPLGPRLGRGPDPAAPGWTSQRPG